MTGFKLFRLPFVALKEVILSVEKSDLISLAMTNRKTRKFINITKNAVSIGKMSQETIDKLNAKDKFNLVLLEDLENSKTDRKHLEFIVSKQMMLSFSFHYSFADKNGSSKRCLNFYFQINPIGVRIKGKEGLMKFGELELPVVETKSTIFTLWEDIDYGSQVLSSHFLQQFKFDTILLDVDPKDTDGKFSRSLKNSVAILKTPLGKTPDLWVENINLMTESDVQLAFHNMKYDEIDITGPRNGRFPGNFECEGMELDVSEAGGFSVKNLLNSKCKTVYLRGTQMTNRVMTKVLTHWLNQKLETLRSLQIELRDEVDVEMIVTGLPERTFCLLDRTERSTSITRGDGSRAVIRIPGRAKTFKMEIFEN